MDWPEKLAEIREKIARLGQKLTRLSNDNEQLMVENRRLREKFEKGANELAFMRQQIADLRSRLEANAGTTPKRVLSEDEE